MQSSRWKKSKRIEAANSLLYVVLCVALFCLHFTRSPGYGELAVKTLFSSLMVYFMCVDFRQWRVPVIPSLISCLLGLLSVFVQEEPTLAERVIGALGGFLVLWSLLVITTYVSRKAGTLTGDEFSIGSGDFLIILVIGTFVGYVDMPRVIALGCLQAVAAFALGAYFPSLALSSPWGTQKSSYPLGAFLCLAAIEILIVAF